MSKANYAKCCIRVIFVLLLFLAGMLIVTESVKANSVKTVKASEISGSEWKFDLDEQHQTIQLIVDKDIELTKISNSNDELVGTLHIIGDGNGYKLTIKKSGISVALIDIVIENTIVHINTKDSGIGIHTYGSLEVKNSNLDIEAYPSMWAVTCGDGIKIEECDIRLPAGGSVEDLKNKPVVSVRSNRLINHTNITVTEPKQGEKAGLTGIADDPNIVISRMLNNDKGVTWSEGEKEYGLGQDCIFQVGHTYRCTAGISAKIGKVTSATKVKINGHDATFKEMKSEHAYFYYDFELEPDTPVKKDEATKQDKDVVADSTSMITDKTGTYSVQNNEATFTAPAKKTAKTVTVPATIKAGGKTVKVTAIAPNALKGMKKLTKVTIGSNVTTIGKNAFANDAKLTTVTIGKNVKSIGAKAFYKCKALKKITIKTKKLTKKTIGSKAFTGINKKAVIKSPKAKKAAYKKILLKKGIKKTMTFK